MRKFSLLFGVLWLAVQPVRADVKLPTFFSDHMVLQRELAVPIWGEADPGEKITVKFRNQEKIATADAQGKWLVKLAPLTAGGPDKLVITGNKPVEIDDVLVGEVWIGSGQSNMAGWLKEYTKLDTNLAALAAAGPYPQIRQMGLPGNWQVYCDARWHVADKVQADNFSAQLFAFGVRLQKELNVPVGLILAAASGSASGSWISDEALKNNAECQASIQKFITTNWDKEAAQKRYETRLEGWKKAVEEARANKKPEPGPPCPAEVPGELYCAKVGQFYEKYVRPLIPYAFRGVVWDQGENNTGVIGVNDQSIMMPALIQCWRKDWGQGDFPFLYVQKPSGFGCGWDYTSPVTGSAEPFVALPERTLPDVGAGEMEVYLRIKSHPNTAMVISSDLGSGQHPTNKFAYAYRDATVALGMVYGKPVEYYGPVYQSHTVENGKVRIKFTHVGKGLAFKNGDKLQGFVMAGADKQFHWADAVIDGDTVVLSSPKVSQPESIRYAWSLKRAWANLFNKDGLPAIPFRTDRW